MFSLECAPSIAWRNWGPLKVHSQGCATIFPKITAATFTEEGNPEKIGAI